MTKGESRIPAVRLPAHFTRPLPDELLFSTLCRLKVRLNMSHRAFVAHFGVSKYPAQARNPLFPVPIGHLAEIIPPETATKDELLRNQTLLPFLKPFVLPKYYEKVLNRTESGTSRVDLAKRVSSPELQFCARCAEEDQKKHGTPYFRRFHQLPGTTVCVAHRLRLIPIPRPYHTGYFFFDLRKLLEIPTKSSPKVSDRAITLAQDLYAIPQIFDSMEPTDVWGAIRWELGKISVWAISSGVLANRMPRA